MAVVEYDKDGFIGLVTINRPEALNAISPEVVCLLGDIWSEAANDDTVRVMILTGTGDRAFCSGADLGRMAPLLTGDRPPEDEFDERVLGDASALDHAMLRVTDFDKPVIAAVNGHAIAGGLELMQGTDLRVAADHARFGVQEVKWGLFPAGGSSVRLPVQLPYAIAMEFLLCGTLIDAQQALDYGFVNRVVPGSEVMENAYELAHTLAANGPLAVRAIKRSVKECLGLTEPEAMAREWQLAGPVFDSEDAREGPRAFMEKRTPEFKGR